MYSPFLYGRQQELYALGDLAAQLAREGRVVPLIEPVKPASTLHSRLTVLRREGAPVYLIANPSRGDLANAIAQTEWHRTIAPHLADSANVYPVFRESDGQGLPELATFLSAYSNRRIGVLLSTSLIAGVDLAAVLSGRDFMVFFEPAVSAVAYIPAIPSDRTIDVGDRFHGQARNADFAGVPEEFFSNDLTTWKASNRGGFSDYTMLTTTYSESGGQAGALAIHLGFMDGTSLRVRHFVSDTSTRGNDAVKWSEVLKKIEDEIVALPGRFDATAGLAAYRSQYATGNYTSLATSKRQQIVHHLQTVSSHMVV